jgi:hypothetical protein
VNGRLLVVAAVVWVAVVGVVTAAAVVGPSDVEATVGIARQGTGSFNVFTHTEAAPAVLGTMASEASAKLEPMINRLAHIVNAFL